MALEIFLHSLWHRSGMGKGGFQVFSILDSLKATFRLTSGNVHMAMIQRSLSGKIHLEESKD